MGNVEWMSLQRAGKWTEAPRCGEYHFPGLSCVPHTNSELYENSICELHKFCGFLASNRASLKSSELGINGFRLSNPAGCLDTTPWPAHPHRGHLHLYDGSAVPDLLSSGHWRVDPADQVGPAAGRRGLRVPNIHAAGAQLLCQLEYCRWVLWGINILRAVSLENIHFKNKTNWARFDKGILLSEYKSETLYGI